MSSRLFAAEAARSKAPPSHRRSRALAAKAGSRLLKRQKLRAGGGAPTVGALPRQRMVSV